MREIKFRAFRKSANQMFSWAMLNAYMSHITGDIASLFEGEHDDLSLMQFTGLKDKNGVEIYEGDIIAAKFQPHYVERVSWHGEPDAICNVFWDYNGFRLEAWGKDDRRFADFTDFERLEFADEMMVDMNTEHSEVIGNIHENPELLESK